MDSKTDPKTVVATPRELNAVLTAEEREYVLHRLNKLVLRDELNYANVEETKALLLKIAADVQARSLLLA